VSKKWNKSFRVIIAQQRWDNLIQSIANDEIKEWLYHSHTYPQELKKMRQAVSRVKAAYGFSALTPRKCAMTQ
jgi:hypothetical protein